MTKRKPRSEFQRFVVEVTRDDWRHAKLMCRASDRSLHGFAMRTVNGEKVAGEGTSGNCVIADALVEWLGSDIPVVERRVYDAKTMGYKMVKVAKVSVSVNDASIGDNHYQHSGAKLVNAFDSGRKLDDALKDYGVKLPMKVTFTRSK